MDCHSNPDFMVTNKKLYNYYREWDQSRHTQMGVTCSDCHFGNPSSTNKTKAHKGKGGNKLYSAVNFKQIPKTCSNCHDQIFKGYKQSNHFKHLSPKKGDEQGPNCVTCHGSMNIAALNVVTVKKVCLNCHNPETKNHPQIPETAEYLLNKFLTIHRFYRFISLKGDPAQTREFLIEVDDKLGKLSAKWHTFNLEGIKEDTLWLLNRVKQRQKEISKKK